MLSIKPVILWTDALFFAFLIFTGLGLMLARQNHHWRMAWRQLSTRPMAMAAFVIMMAYLVIGIMDSLHYRTSISGDHGVYFGQTQSLLTAWLHPLDERNEYSYSAPMALYSYQKMVRFQNNTVHYKHARLQHVAPYLKDAGEMYGYDLANRGVWALIKAILSWSLLTGIITGGLKRRYGEDWRHMLNRLMRGHTVAAWRSILVTLFIVFLIVAIVDQYSSAYYILGTNRIGQDVFYQAVQSIRTGLLIGTLTTLVMLPFALWLGMMAGFLGGWVDDIIQFIYITLSSIPAVLLISALVLAFQVMVANHPQWFYTAQERADIRLLGLCVILGITSWTSLCRLLRGETLKIRELEYIDAAWVLGVSRWRIMLRHIMPNIMHIVIITVILDFSMLVLAEAVLTYIGVGVHPTMMSWGQMINSARLELAREPIIWWPLLTAFVFMFTFVFSVNVFADKVRDALDPRIRQMTNHE